MKKGPPVEVAPVACPTRFGGGREPGGMAYREAAGDVRPYLLSSGVSNEGSSRTIDGSVGVLPRDIVRSVLRQHLGPGGRSARTNRHRTGAIGGETSGGTVQLTATAFDEAGSMIAPQPSFSWS